ncbi:hypothetical protein FHX74_000440 [Friedmanniella endophytica]|uniref:Uncharacterized protein n=1 Tax=Microlunatus kandeliicorticis TaxID=1759536 RepID=A0A7W3IPH3_9ACTN|nr:hypothetical protein [Microlunatus kandeliicorticis]
MEVGSINRLKVYVDVAWTANAGCVITSENNHWTVGQGNGPDISVAHHESYWQTWAGQSHGEFETDYQFKVCEPSQVGITCSYPWIHVFVYGNGDSHSSHS